MSASLNKFRHELSEMVLTFVWQQWSSIGVMATGGAERTRVVDPEPLLLLTLEVARQDPRMFDEVVDWLIVNGKWVNVVRLSALLNEDKICSPEVLGAVAATLARYDKTPKWRTLAKRFKPKRTKEPEPLFWKAGESLLLPGTEADATFRSYGLLRSPLTTRGMSAPVVPSPTPMWSAANFMFKARALFGVNIRADVFAFLVLQGAANPTRIARELGYSQRRVQDALTDMAAADVFKVRTVGKAREYFVDSESVLRSLGATESEVAWFDWRALSRALATIWRAAFELRETGLTPYVLESEQEKVLREVKNDLLTAAPRRKSEIRPETSGPTRTKGLISSLQNTLASSPGYNWKRFWVPGDGVISYADGGYPFVPKQDKSWPSLIQSDVVDFESVAQVPCLALLGEPGMGKSFALRNAIKTLETSLSETGGKLLFLDLRSYGSEERLIRDLFESETFRAWSRGEHQLHVFLDSLDEALLHQGTIANLLVDKLSELPSVAGLFFRIACRTAEWPAALENGLKSKWGDKSVGILKLVPLTRGDVIEAAEASAIDADEFLREVDNHEAVPLAFKPVTLKFLLKSIQQTGQLASAQKDLYTQGCRILCAEANESRIGARLAGKLTAEQRMEVAAHIAAATVFCNRNAIWTGANTGIAPDSSVTLDELCTGRFGDRGEPVTREVVVETLETGLFSSRGPDRLGWAHQTYAEFLAAWHLHRRGMSLSQMLSLIVHPGDADRRLVPQLHETAAWLASMDVAVFRELMKSDPDVLLRSDVATASAEDREKLVASLLVQFEEEKLLDCDWSLSARYRKLAHPGMPHQLLRLTEQLRPYILDRTKNPAVRREAIDMAKACELKALGADLALVALDSSEEPSIRTGAASFVAKVDEPALRARLKPLLNLPAEEDPADELKGCALKACWPESMTAEELFQVLTPPKRVSFSGAYMSFSRSLIESLKPSDLLLALRWVRQQKARHELQISFRERLDEVLDRSARSLDYPGILQEFAKTILDRLAKHDAMYGSKKAGWHDVLTSDETARRRVIEILIAEMRDPQKDAFHITCCGFPLVRDADVPWLAERLEHEADSKTQAGLAHLLRYSFKITEVSHIDSLIRAAEKNELLRGLFSYYLTPISLGSEKARKERQEYFEQKAFEARVSQAEERRTLSPPPAERVATLLDRFETHGELDAWWGLVMEMTRGPTSTHYEHEDKMDLTQLPGWVSADAATRARIIAAAKKYLLERDANPDAWFWKHNKWHRPAVAGYKALYLLLKEAPEAFAHLPGHVWANWMPIIVHQAGYHGAEHGVIASTAYRAAPNEMVRWLAHIIDKEDDRGVLRQLEGVWDDRLAAMFLEKAKTPGLKPKVLRPLLETLLAHDVSAAREVAESLIQQPLPANSEGLEKAVDAAKAMLIHCRDGWSVVWPAILQDPKFGRDLFETIAGDHRRAPAKIADKLTANQVADLYIWLVGQFPPAKDPNEEGAHFVSGRESVADFRNSLASHLKERGTPEACQAIQRLIIQFPSFRWLKWMLAQAKATLRKNTWKPPNPHELFKLASQRELRLVRDGDELLELVVESLLRLEKKLQGETPASEFLWDKVASKSVYRPKDEGALANFVKLHLETDLKARGVIVNREVEIRRGEETDIHIDAITKESGKNYDRVSVIVEAKGSWHRELETAIESQLVNRYLHDNACQHGLYLVGWFNCPKWDQEDYRSKASARFAKKQLQDSLKINAARLSGAALRVDALVLNAALR